MPVITMAVLLIAVLAAPAQANENGAAEFSGRFSERNDVRALGTGIKAIGGKARKEAAGKLRSSRPQEPPPSQEEIRNNAIEQAFQLGQYSNAGVTSEIPLKNSQVASGPEALAASPPLTWPLPGAPNESDVENCLSAPEASSYWGRTLNRWTWCQSFYTGVEYKQKDADGVEHLVGTVTLEFEAYALTSYKERGARVYWRAKPGTLEVDTANLDFARKAPNFGLIIKADCSRSTFECERDPLDIPVQRTWSNWENSSNWTSWTLRSPKKGFGIDLVAYHPWSFVYAGPPNEEFIVDEFTGVNRTLRCDSALYITWGQNSYSEGCAAYDVIPRIQYAISDERVKGVAEHIQHAFDNPGPGLTYPISEAAKNIPGRYSESRDGRALHRIRSDDERWKQNEDVKDAACNRVDPYQETGHPWYNTSTHECDEFPFRSTIEGAANPTYDFSVRAVPHSENEAAGGLLTYYYFRDRILEKQQDEFWVSIKP